MGCLHRLGQPQRRGDFDIVGRNYADSHTHAGSDPDTNPHAAKDAQEEGQSLVPRAAFKEDFTTGRIEIME